MEAKAILISLSVALLATLMGSDRLPRRPTVPIGFLADSSTSTASTNGVVKLHKNADLPTGFSGLSTSNPAPHFTSNGVDDNDAVMKDMPNVSTSTAMSAIGRSPFVSSDPDSPTFLVKSFLERGMQDVNCTIDFILSCKNSNAGKKLCGRYRGKYCSCDALCLLNKDCCVDFETVCPTVHTEAKVFKSRYPGVQMECMREVAGTVISNCREEPTQDANLVKLCMSRPSNIFDPSVVPMYDTSTGLSFKNKYCSLCNGAKEESLVSWNLTVKEFQDSVASLNNLVWGNYVDQNVAANFKWVSLNARFCLSSATHHCPGDVGALATLCDNHMTSFVEDTVNRVLYRNKYCLICDGGITCSGAILIPEPIGAFSVLMMVDGGKEKVQVKPSAGCCERECHILLVSGTNDVNWSMARCNIVDGALKGCHMTQCKTDMYPFNGECIPNVWLTRVYLHLDFERANTGKHCVVEYKQQVRQDPDEHSTTTVNFWTTLRKKVPISSTKNPKIQTAIRGCTESYVLDSPLPVPEAPSAEGANCTLFNQIVLQARDSLGEVDNSHLMQAAGCNQTAENKYFLSFDFHSQPPQFTPENVTARLRAAAENWLPAILRQGRVCGVVTGCFGMQESECNGTSRHLQMNIICNEFDHQKENAASQTTHPELKTLCFLLFCSFLI